ncbi:MAG: metal ABC transporter substrate-binding protein [Ilumatobacteraceae bacterium]
MLLAAVASGASACGGSSTEVASSDTGGDPQTAALDACLAGTPRPAGQRLTITTTVAPITSIVANVVGDLADITGIVPEGTNSHTFEPPPSVAASLASSDAVFVNGLVLEEPTKDLAAANLPDGGVLCELGTSILPVANYIYDFSFPKDAGKPNPHLWTNPPMAIQYTELVRDVVVRLDPANGDAYAANAATYIDRLRALDAAVRAATETVEPANRTLLTYHDAYAYFAATYGWTVIGAIQPSSFDEPTAKEIAELIAQVRDSGVPAIFGSEVFPSPVLAQIGDETGVQYVDVLRDDDLPGEPGDAAHSFLGLMQFDYITMVQALGGDATALQALDVTDVVTDTAEYPQ